MGLRVKVLVAGCPTWRVGEVDLATTQVYCGADRVSRRRDPQHPLRPAPRDGEEMDGDLVREVPVVSGLVPQVNWLEVAAYGVLLATIKGTRQDVIDELKDTVQPGWHRHGRGQARTTHPEE